MNPILIVNLNQSYVKAHYVGRAFTQKVGKQFRHWNASALGNPFRIGQDGTREQCVEKYRRWLFEQSKDPKSPALRELNALVEQYRRGETIILGCWCCPKACHAHVIRRAILYLAKGGNAASSQPNQAHA
jgi:hypothetical protein